MVVDEMLALVVPGSERVKLTVVQQVASCVEVVGHPVGDTVKARQWESCVSESRDADA